MWLASGTCKRSWLAGPANEGGSVDTVGPRRCPTKQPTRRLSQCSVQVGPEVARLGNMEALCSKSNDTSKDIASRLCWHAGGYAEVVRVEYTAGALTVPPGGSGDRLLPGPSHFRTSSICLAQDGCGVAMQKTCWWSAPASAVARLSPSTAAWCASTGP